MRIRLPLGRGLFFLCAFLFALVALLPLRLALDWFGLPDHGLTARDAHGSVWLGTLDEARVGPVELGDLGAGLRTLPLIVGRARLDVRALGDEDRFEGGLTSTRHGFGIDDVSAKLRLAGGAGALPLATLDTTDVSVRFADGLCRSAEGRVTAGLAGEVGGIRLPPLAGNARCEGGALLLPLASQSGLEMLQFRLYEGGRYRVDLTVRPAVEGAEDALRAAGFVPAAAGYVLRIPGEL
jgi:general secretion pathway protein N